MTENHERISQMMALIHDPLFVAFELEQDAPTIFNAVGRTHTETWHSALLGWLFDPASSHGLGIYPLSQLILMLADEDGAPHTRGIDLHELLLNGDFSQARVRPNERELVEVSKPGVGRFDVFVDQIHYGAWREIQFLIEVKVKAKIEREQCARYMAYGDQLAAAKTLLVPIFIAPTGQLIKPAAEIFGDDRWIALDYQSIYDGIIKPSLDHPQISQFGRFTMLEYVKTLKYRLKGGEPLATTQHERDIARLLLEKHETAIRALYEILSENNDDFQPLPTAAAASTPTTIKVRIGTQQFAAQSIRDLYTQVMQFLDEHGYMERLTLPIPSGFRRNLLATEAIHQNGNGFILPAKYKNKYYMEANKSRDTGLRDLAKLLEQCGLSMSVVA